MAHQDSFLNISSPEDKKLLLETARTAAKNYLSHSQDPLPLLPEHLHKSCGVFVTFFTKNNLHRGCIGHIEPIYNSLTEEISQCAILAATRDPRFPPITAEEIDSLRMEVSLLHPFEKVESKDSLDPKNYGVFVQKGNRRGLLLADIDGIDTVDYQLECVLQKAGIEPDEDFEIERFKISKVKE